MMLSKRAVIFVEKQQKTEKYKAFFPKPLPPQPLLDMEKVYPYLEKASHAIGVLNGVAKVVPNHALFIYMYVRKEALLSSQIEGTQASLSDLLQLENNMNPDAPFADVEEVSHYVAALQHGVARLRDGFPLCLRLLREIHAILLRGERGADKKPGEFRTVQNWIGGTRPGNALFVPPAPDDLMSALDQLEHFLHSSDSLPLLVRAGLVHAQFESIHPFLDGNGRLGRVLILLMLCEQGVLDEPLLYISLYFKAHRSVYFDLLQQVRVHGDWETWLEFFLIGVAESATQAAHTITSLQTMFDRHQEVVASLGKARFICERIMTALQRSPKTSVRFLVDELGVTPPTARNGLQVLEKHGIVTEVTGKSRDRVYVYHEYLALLESGITR